MITGEGDRYHLQGGRGGLWFWDRYIDPSLAEARLTNKSQILSLLEMYSKDFLQAGHSSILHSSEVRSG
jgi:hypothetical protein